MVNTITCEQLDRLTVLKGKYEANNIRRCNADDWVKSIGTDRVYYTIAQRRSFNAHTTMAFDRFHKYCYEIGINSYSVNFMDSEFDSSNPYKIKLKSGKIDMDRIRGIEKLDNGSYKSDNTIKVWVDYGSL